MPSAVGTFSSSVQMRTDVQAAPRGAVALQRMSLPGHSDPVSKKIRFPLVTV